MKVRMLVFAIMASLEILIAPRHGNADWPQLRGNAGHTGYVEAQVKAPLRLIWTRQFSGERLGTALEPIVAANKVFVATHAGNLYALDANSGEPLWRFAAHGPFLHSPAVAEDVVVAPCADGNLYGVEATSGKQLWSMSVGSSGFAAAPTIALERTLIGTRAGEFLAVETGSGKVLWRRRFDAPVRQTAAVDEGMAFVTSEDLRVHALVLETGEPRWTSEPLVGQTARDYYPVVAKTGRRTFVIVRTNPLLNMAQRIGRDRTMLCRQAGVDDSSWKTVDAWIKSDAARGTPQLWAREQEAIIEHLEKHPDARTYFELDAETGKIARTSPLLWIAGCQGVGAMPAATSDGKLLVFHRSAYSNWNHGVAPLVGLGLLDLDKNEISPLFHEEGRQPPWNAFWGTADESQNFVVAGSTALLIHQGTLSSLDLKSNRLAPLFGERDTYGGFRNPPWARNEWHGPARSGVAIVDSRIYWQTGSRILCLASGDRGPSVREIATTHAESVKTEQAPRVAARDGSELRADLERAIEEILSKYWTPLFTDPGLSGRDFSFDDSSELFKTLAWAFPQVATSLKTQISERLAQEWTKHPPFTADAFYSLREGEPREWFEMPAEFRARIGGDRPPHPFGGVYAAWLFGKRCGEQKTVAAAWPKIKISLEAFLQSGWKLDPSRGDLYANRYLASLLAAAQLAREAGDTEAATRAREKAGETTRALVTWWKRAGAGSTLGEFKTSSELDPFITSGDAISLRIAPHRHKLALFADLTPEVAALVRKEAPQQAKKVWGVFNSLYRTWHVVGEERQVHFGENFVDPPDLALGAFKALAWIEKASAPECARRVDLPFCRADLYYAQKLAIALEAGIDPK